MGSHFEKEGLPDVVNQHFPCDDKGYGIKPGLITDLTMPVQYMFLFFCDLCTKYA